MCDVGFQGQDTTQIEDQEANMIVVSVQHGHVTTPPSFTYTSLSLNNRPKIASQHSAHPPWMLQSTRSYPTYLHYTSSFHVTLTHESFHASNL